MRTVRVPWIINEKTEAETGKRRRMIMRASEKAYQTLNRGDASEEPPTAGICMPPIG